MKELILKIKKFLKRAWKILGRPQIGVIVAVLTLALIAAQAFGWLTIFGEHPSERTWGQKVIDCTLPWRRC